MHVRDGTVLQRAAFNYSSWVKTKHRNSNPMQYPQHPRNCIETVEDVISAALKAAGAAARGRAVGFAFDRTGNLPCIVDETCAPLALRPSLTDNPSTMYVFCKNHISVKGEGTAVHEPAPNSTPEYAFCGDTNFFEWF
nr:unnamed protein product [Leishmania braziliensis]